MNEKGRGGMEEEWMKREREETNGIRMDEKGMKRNGRRRDEKGRSGMEEE